ncbi:MAG: T9SS type A sorting domain-containing protein [Chitinophagales bacterium]|nr:T9SS type A sorting domain-containing protein [Chitinophagales bacterium]
MNKTLRKLAMSIIMLVAFHGMRYPLYGQTSCPIDATIEADGPLEFCDGGTVTLTAYPSGYCYEWSTGQTTQSITVPESGTYTVTVSTCDGAGSSDYEIVAGGFRTQTQGGWGSKPNGGNPGAYLHDHFDGAFPAGIVIGCDFTITLTSADEVTDFLPQGSTPNALDQNYLDPGDDNITVLAGQVMALALSVGFDNTYADFGSSDTNLGDLIISSGTFEGWTVNELLAEGNKILGGCASIYTPSTINDALSSVNENFVDGTSAGSYLECPPGESDCSDTASVTVTEYEVLVVTIDPASPVNICEGDSVTLCASPSGPGYSYTWKDISSEETLGNEQCLTVYEAGAYYVRIFNEFGCHSECTPTDVIVNPVPECSITPDGPTEFCEGGSVTLTAPAGYIYMWSTGETTQSITVSESGTYSVIISTEAGCSSECSIEVIVHEIPVVTIEPASPVNICEGDSVTLCAYPAGPGYTYTWKNITTEETLSNEQCLTVYESGAYYVRIFNEFGCHSECTPTDVIVNPVPECSITPDGPTEFCEGGSVTLTAPAGYIYLWSTGETTQSITVSAAGNYSVTISTEAGCSSTCSIDVTTNPGPDASVSASDTEVCQGKKVTLTANAGLGYSYQWYKDGVLIPGATGLSYSTKLGGSYTVEVTSEGGCSTMSASVTITVLPAPHIKLFTPDGKDLCPAGEVSLQIVTAPGSTFQWYFNGSPIPGATSSTYTATEAGFYYAMVTNAEGCKKKCKGVSVVNTCRMQGVPEGNSTLEVYPNPSFGVINLSIVLDDHTNGTIELHNMNGEMVYFEIIKDETHTVSRDFDLSTYPKGIYFATILTDTQMITKKIILQ